MPRTFRQTHHMIHNHFKTLPKIIKKKKKKKKKKGSAHPRPLLTPTCGLHACI